jgi:hypothetical protein
MPEAGSVYATKRLVVYKRRAMLSQIVSVLVSTRLKSHKNQRGELGAITAEFDSIMTDASNKKLVQYDHAH